jgi:hypothetical protein
LDSTDMTTNRVPISRPQVAQITDEAVRLFVAMGKLRCSCPPPAPTWQQPCPGCAQWCDLHEALHDELQLPPWEWPAVARQSPKRAGFFDWNDDIAARMAMLKEAARGRAKPVSKKAPVSAPSPSSLDEEEPHGEPVAGK